MSQTKKFFLVLFVLIMGSLVLLGRQIKRSLDITTAPTNQPLLSAFTTDIPVSPEDQIYGNPGAALSLVEFTDIGCKECQKLHETLVAFVAAHPENVRLIWKDAPEQSIFFKDFIPAHKAAYCAGKQNKFWPYVNAIIADKKYRTEKDLASEVEKTGLSLELWQSCFDNPTTAQKINDNRLLARQLGITSAPVMFVNNKRLTLTPDINVDDLLQAFIAP